MATNNIEKQSFGQAGATFLSDSGVDITGSFCAVLIVEAAVFTTLDWPELNKSRGGSDWLSATVPSVAGETLTGADTIPTHTFPAGVTIYGEFKKIRLTSGKVLAYHAA
tara:strand:- start:1162 stop:1488 length:327 start_codon:yes stop_codon:yes gene_type:complete